MFHPDYLLKIDDIDEYIRYGGILNSIRHANAFDDGSKIICDPLYASFRTDESTRRYIDTAIAQNIQHSLKCYDKGNHFRNLIDLYKKDETKRDF